METPNLTEQLPHITLCVDGCYCEGTCRTLSWILFPLIPSLTVGSEEGSPSSHVTFVWYHLYFGHSNTFLCSLEFSYNVSFAETFALCFWKWPPLPYLKKLSPDSVLSHSFSPLPMRVWSGHCLSSTCSPFCDFLEFGFWPYFSAEFALLKFKNLHFVKSNGYFTIKIYIGLIHCPK